MAPKPHACNRYKRCRVRVRLGSARDNRICCPRKDILNLSYAIRRALTDDAARIRMGEASKEFIEREYTYACMDSKINDIVKRMLHR